MTVINSFRTEGIKLKIQMKSTAPGNCESEE